MSIRYRENYSRQRDLVQKEYSSVYLETFKIILKKIIEPSKFIDICRQIDKIEDCPGNLALRQKVILRLKNDLSEDNFVRLMNSHSGRFLFLDIGELATDNRDKLPFQPPFNH